MNKSRRKEIYSIARRLKNLLKETDINYVSNEISECIDLTQCIFDEEDMCRDNVPENLQNGYRYQESEEACDYLEATIEVLEDINYDDNIESIVYTISNAINYLNEAAS